VFANFAAYEYHLSASLCVLAMLGMGTALPPEAFRDVARRPRTIALVFVVQLLIGPLLAIVLSQAFEQPAGIAAGMLLVTALPGGLFSNVFVLLSRGHVALSISATAVCTLGSLVTTTLVLKTFASGHLPDQFQMPIGEIAFEIVACLLLPLVIGMALGRWRANPAKRLGRICVRTATLLVIVYVVAALQGGRIDLAAFGWKTHAAVIALCVLPIVIGMVMGRLFRVTKLESFTCQMEAVIRNVHLGLLLKASLFPAGSDSALSAQVLFVLLYYGGASLVTGTVMTIIRRIELAIFKDRHWAPPPPELQGW
jgi:bile acid:Na+ symporter, BASS family